MSSKKGNMGEEIKNILSSAVNRIAMSHQAADQFEKHQRRVAEEKAYEWGRKTHELRAAWNAPKRHATAKDLDWNGEWGQVTQRLSNKIESGQGLLVALVGNRGAGKTQIAVELMRVNTSRQKSALYVSTMEWFMAIKSTYKKNTDQTEIDIIKQFRKPNLLVLDEYGRRSDTEWENNLLFELLDKRYSDMNNTVLISNQKAAELMESLGKSLASRLNETGGVIECEWSSWRTQIKPE